MIRPLALVLLAAIFVWPAAAHAQGRGGGGRGGSGARGAANLPQPARGAQAPRGQRGGNSVRRTTEIVVVPSVGYYGGYYDPYVALPGYYPLGEWPYPVLTSPIGSGARGTRANDAALSSEIGRLSQEIELLRAAALRQLPAPQPPPAPVFNAAPPPPPAAAQPERFIPATLLILRDGSRIETQNYAIVGETFWVLDEGKSQKVPFSSIDMAASEKENRGRGVRFLPTDR